MVDDVDSVFVPVNLKMSFRTSEPKRIVVIGECVVFVTVGIERLAVERTERVCVAERCLILSAGSFGSGNRSRSVSVIFPDNSFNPSKVGSRYAVGYFLYGITVR